MTNSVVKEKPHPSWELFNICGIAQIPVRISLFRISGPKRRGRNVNNLIPVSNDININANRTGQFKSPLLPSKVPFFHVRYCLRLTITVESIL